MSVYGTLVSIRFDSVIRPFTFISIGIKTHLYPRGWEQRSQACLLSGANAHKGGKGGREGGETGREREGERGRKGEEGGREAARRWYTRPFHKAPSAEMFEKQLVL